MGQNQSVTLLSDKGVGTLLDGVREQFTQVVEQSRIASIINWQKEAGLARQIIAADTRLQQCTPESIRNAVTNIAYTGLTLNKVKQHATILARWNDKIRGYEAQLVVMYRGLMWLAGQAGVTDIDVDVVYSADRFKIIKSGDGSNFEHEIAYAIPRDEISSKFQGAYVAARMPGSKIRKVEWLPVEQIYKARDKSESYLDKEGNPRKTSPWVWAFDEMAKKVAIKVAQKRWEEAIVESHEWKRFQTAVAIDNANEGVIPAKLSDIPGTAEHISTNDKPAEVALLSIQQIAEIESLAEKAAPNTDKVPANTKNYMKKIARTYRANSLDEVPASKFDEIKERINDAIKKQDQKAAAESSKALGASGAAKQGSAKDAKDSGQQQDAAAKGVGAHGEGKAGAEQTRTKGSGGSSGTRIAGEGGAGRSPGNEDRKHGDPERARDPEDSTRTPGADNGGDSEDPDQR